MINPISVCLVQEDHHNIHYFEKVSGGLAVLDKSYLVKIKAV